MFKKNNRFLVHQTWAIGVQSILEFLQIIHVFLAYGNTVRPFVNMDCIFEISEYQLSFSEESVNDDLLGNHFGSLGNPNSVFFFYRLFGLRKLCDKTFRDFLQECLLILSSMKCDSCLKLLKYPLTIHVHSIWLGGGFAFFKFN